MVFSTTGEKCRSVFPRWTGFCCLPWLFSEGFHEYLLELKAGNQALRDSAQILLQITKCRYLRHRFVDVFSMDTFPILLNENAYVIVNSESSEEEGKHWLLISKKDGVCLFGDPLGLRWAPIQKPLQPPTSNLGGLYCINVAPFFFSGYSPVMPLFDDERYLGFVKLSNFSFIFALVKFINFSLSFFFNTGWMKMKS